LLKNISEWKSKDIVKILQWDNIANLYKVALNFTCNNPEIIFESEEFLKMEETCLIQLLKCDYLKLEEIKIWEYLLKWGIKNTNSILNNDIKTWEPSNFIDLNKTLQNCIRHIRFFQMSPDDYMKIRSSFKDILPDDLDEEVLQYFSSSTSKLFVNVSPPRYIFDSKIINAADIALIASWINKKQGTSYHFKDLPYKFNLIYRASRDGFGIDKFHKNCDNKGPTIIVIKVRHPREIIGGYNPLEWCHNKMVEDERSSLSSRNREFSKNYQFKTSNSFIFSLTSRFNPILSRVAFEKEAITWSQNRGPCFGLQDLYIKSSGSFINSIVGKSKQHSYEKKIIDRETFEIEEYEVFQVIDNRSYTFMLIRFQKIFKKIFYIIKWSFIIILSIILMTITSAWFIVILEILTGTQIVATEKHTTKRSI
jgi:hypothetical protein